MHTSFPLVYINHCQHKVITLTPSVYFFFLLATDIKQLKELVQRLDNTRKQIDRIEAVARFDAFYEHFGFSSDINGKGKTIPSTEFRKYAYRAIYTRYRIEYHWRDENTTLLAAEALIGRYREVSV